MGWDTGGSPPGARPGCIGWGGGKSNETHTGPLEQDPAALGGVWGGGVGRPPQDPWSRARLHWSGARPPGNPPGPLDWGHAALGGTPRTPREGSGCTGGWETHRRPPTTPTSPPVGLGCTVGCRGHPRDPPQWGDAQPPASHHPPGDAPWWVKPTPLPPSPCPPGPSSPPHGFFNFFFPQKAHF